MNSRLKESLITQAQKSGYAYVRNLVAAEVAVLRGQFNVAKVLRASGHAHRVLAMQSARLSGDDFSPSALFRINLAEVEGTLVQIPETQDEMDADVKAKLKESTLARERVRDLILRSIKSMETHADVMESDVAQSLWGCYSCGYIAEGNRPDACPVCGALGAEFEWFGPFYAMSPEHLGQLTPLQILTTLEAVPNAVAEIISGLDDKTLSRRPSEQEWCIKELIGHMLETDILFSKRVTIVLEGQGLSDINTPVPPWKLQEGKGYDKMSIDELLERLRQTRSVSLALVRGLNPEQWSRRGTLRGTSASLIDLGTWLANHDLGHSAQIRRLCNK